MKQNTSHVGSCRPQLNIKVKFCCVVSAEITSTEGVSMCPCVSAFLGQIKLTYKGVQNCDKILMQMEHSKKGKA